MSILWGCGWEGWPKGPRARRLLLLRHGQTAWNANGTFQGQRDVPLDDEGRRQAHAVAKRLEGRKIHALVSSDLSRAAETARIVNARLGLEIHWDARLREIDIGEWSGRKSKDVVPQESGLAAAIQRGEDPPRGGAETLAMLRERVQAGLFDALRLAPGGTLLMVAHGGVSRTVASILLGLPDAFAGRLSSGRNTSIGEFKLTDDGPRLKRWNDASHLG